MELSKFSENPWKLVIGGFLGALVAALVAGAAYVFISTQSLNKEKTAQESYFMVEKKLLELKAKQVAPTAPNLKKDSKKTTLNEDIDFSQSKKDLEKIISDYPTTIASQMAALHLAKLLLDEKNLAGALIILQKIGNKNNGLINTLVQHQIGQLLADQGKCPEAISIWQKILNNKNVEFIHNETKIQQALCYTKLNDFKKAEEILTNLANQSMNSEIGTDSSLKEAEKYLRLIQFKKASGT